MRVKELFEIYTKEIVENAVKQSYSVANASRLLFHRENVSNADRLRFGKLVEHYNIDISHFTGQKWRKDLHYVEKTALVKLETILQKDVNYSSDQLRKRLIAANIKECKCEKCGRTDWLGEPIPLELHHINGDHYDNRLENLQILCHNCHSQTKNFKTKNCTNTTKRKLPHIYTQVKGEKKILKCKECGKEFTVDRSKSKSFCSRECYLKHVNNQININANTSDGRFEETKKILSLEMVKYTNLTQLGKVFNVSRITMRNWLKKYELLDEFKKYEKHPNAKQVGKYDKNLNLIQIYDSISEVNRTLNTKTDLKNIINKDKLYKGFYWKYIN